MEWKNLLCDKRQSSSKGSNKNDLRNEFQKDYHRIICSASFRRLQDKTQVFPLDNSDFVRTRLLILWRSPPLPNLLDRQLFSILLTTTKMTN